MMQQQRGGYIDHSLRSTGRVKNAAIWRIGIERDAAVESRDDEGCSRAEDRANGMLQCGGEGW